ncbi:unnamed protein product [Tilletia laevis]|uniref:Uncharacterized protein n=3 Tax=Tilletia TaxID=13289 RepID=A0A8X7MTA8_9BASI|nr:hypothetical protein CF336_g4192 [Tilletia laevis]KAE8197341.1 hypothetical protein CF328_g3881 [Tilletia controversa]KAE8261158.1 hypothetical protein A4X03_0g3491 [Tilletia caries]KAE8205186.1 hypothetical protein CF335_g2387 [Tilletia laevis]KAE8247279.1 hypothetical protein A4X06_0g4572 [Tilletia controversa]
MLRQVMMGTCCFLDGESGLRSSSAAIQYHCNSFENELLLELDGCKSRGITRKSGNIFKRGDDAFFVCGNGDRVRLQDACLASVLVVENENQTNMLRIEGVIEQESDAAVPPPSISINGRACGSYVVVRGCFCIPHAATITADTFKRYRVGLEEKNVPIAAILCAVSLAHDCAYHGCEAVIAPGGRQEREATQANKTTIRHNQNGQQHYVLNDGLIRTSALLNTLYGRVPAHHTLSDASAAAMEARRTQ